MEEKENFRVQLWHRECTAACARHHGKSPAQVKGSYLVHLNCPADYRAGDLFCRDTVASMERLGIIQPDEIGTLQELRDAAAGQLSSFLDHDCPSIFTAQHVIHAVKARRLACDPYRSIQSRSGECLVVRHPTDDLKTLAGTGEKDRVFARYLTSAGRRKTYPATHGFCRFTMPCSYHNVRQRYATSLGCVFGKFQRRSGWRVRSCPMDENRKSQCQILRRAAVPQI